MNAVELHTPADASLPSNSASNFYYHSSFYKARHKASRQQNSDVEAAQELSGSDRRLSNRQQLQQQHRYDPEVEPTMFYACMAILLMFVLMVASLIVSIIDLDRYNFGLYFVLLSIVGIMIACAFCVANPNMCANPQWYARLCQLLHELYPESPTKEPLNPPPPIVPAEPSKEASNLLPVRSESRATVMMLAPAVHIMHHVWRGMAWVAEDVEPATCDDDDTTTGFFSQTLSSTQLDRQSCDSLPLKRLSTIPELSTADREETTATSQRDGNGLATVSEDSGVAAGPLPKSQSLVQVVVVERAPPVISIERASSSDAILDDV